MIELAAAIGSGRSPSEVSCGTHGPVEQAQAHAATHESRRARKLYDRTAEDLSLDEIERIAI